MTVVANSLHAFDAVGLNRGQASVLSAIRALHRPGEPAARQPSDQDIADWLAWGINRVTPRRGELQAAGRILRAGDKPGRFGLRVAVWAPTPEQLSFWKTLHHGAPR
jgi:hypothetical protein